MKILFYDMAQRETISSSGSHVFEVLNNLSKLGHRITYADGESFYEAKQLSNKTGSNQRQSLFKQIRRLVGVSPLRGEARIFYTFLQEVRLFVLAFITVLRYKPEIIYRRHMLFNSEYLLAKLFRIPSVREVNGIGADEREITLSGNSLSLRVIDWIERFSMPKADKLIVVTAKMKELLHDKYRIPEDKIVVIENGANTDLFKPIKKDAKADLELDSNYHYIGFVGSFAVWHGLDDLVKSAPLILGQVPKAKFLLVGDGQVKNEIIRMVDELGLRDNFIFIGSIPYEEVPKYINAFDVCVTPMKKGILGSPLKLCEYMACEKPVVASRKSCFQILEENNAGLLVNPENPEALANAITKLLQSPKLREQMGTNGRNYVVENRSWENVAKRVAENCRQAIRTKHD